MGQGTYGCGFVPALRCDDEEAPTPNTFSKLITKGEGMLEIERIALLPQIDPAMEFTIYAKKLCNLRKNNIAPHAENFKKCEVLKKKGIVTSNNSLMDDMTAKSNAELMLIQSPMASRDLEKYAFDVGRTDVHAWAYVFESFINIFNGLTRLHAASFYHMDIKLNNIVTILNERNRVVNLKFIDFGMSISGPIVTKYTEARIRRMYSKNYDIYPLEMVFFNKTKAERDALTDDEIKEIVRKKYEKTIGPPDMGKVLTVDRVRAMFNSLDTMDTTGDIRHYLQVVDVYSLGCALYDLMVIMCNYQVKDRHFQFADDAVMRAQQQGSSPAEIRVRKQFLNYYSQIVIPKLYAVIGKLMHHDPLRRPLAAEAAAIYAQFAHDTVNGYGELGRIIRAAANPFIPPMLSPEAAAAATAAPASAASAPAPATDASAAPASAASATAASATAASATDASTAAAAAADEVQEPATKRRKLNKGGARGRKMTRRRSVKPKRIRHKSRSTQ